MRLRYQYVTPPVHVGVYSKNITKDTIKCFKAKLLSHSRWLFSAFKIKCHEKLKIELQIGTYKVKVISFCRATFRYSAVQSPFDINFHCHLATLGN